MATITVPTDVEVGERLSIVGAAFANSTPYTVRVVFNRVGLDVTLRGTTSGAGAFTNTDLVVPEGEGTMTYTASDGTNTATGTTRVMHR